MDFAGSLRDSPRLPGRGAGVRGQATIQALRWAVPYLRIYRGQTFVVKAGGEAFADRRTATALLEQVGVLHQLGVRCVFVHGGGPQATRLMERLGVESTFVEGRRVTSPEAAQAMLMALHGEVQGVVSSVAREVGLRAVSCSGLDGGLTLAAKRPPVRVGGENVDYGEVGDIEAVDTGLVSTLLDAGFLPVVSPLSADTTGRVLNVNADTVACELAVALGASKLILATAAPGVLRDPRDPGSVVSYLDLKSLAAMEEEGSLRDGMLPKAKAISRALQSGVDRVHVVGHQVPDALLTEVFTNEGSGTLIVRSLDEMRPEEAGS